MADRNDATQGAVSDTGAAGRVPSTTLARGEHSNSVVAEFIDAARSAAESMLEEQKRQIAGRVSGVADALKGAVSPLDQSQNRIIARYIERAADQVDNFAHMVRSRRWGELVADTEEFARRQPTWFVLGAVGAGFLVGRFLWTSIGGQGRPADRMGSSSETARSVTAAVSSSPGTGELTGSAARGSIAEAR